MKKYTIQLAATILLAILILSGCLPIDKPIEFKNVNRDVVFNKTIQFIISKGWEITYKDKDAGVISFIYKERYTPGVVQQETNNISKRMPAMAPIAMAPRKLKYIISIIIVKKDVNTIVRLKTTDTFIWDPEKIIKEYKEFIGQ